MWYTESRFCYWYTESHILAYFNLVNKAFATGTLSPGLTNTLIVFILMKDTPLALKDFKHISLCNVLFKVISKVLVIWIVHNIHTKKGRFGILFFKVDFKKPMIESIGIF